MWDPQQSVIKETFNPTPPLQKKDSSRWWSIWRIYYLLKLFLSLLFHPPDILHGQAHPSVNPAEQLAVEVCKNPLFLLWKGWKMIGMEKKKQNKPSYFSSRTLTVMGTWTLIPTLISSLSWTILHNLILAPSSLLKHSSVSLCWPPIAQAQAELHALVQIISYITLWMKFSTLVCRPHHLNLTVTSLYAHMWGQSVFSSFCEKVKKKEVKRSEITDMTEQSQPTSSCPTTSPFLCQVPSIRGLRVLCRSLKSGKEQDLLLGCSPENKRMTLNHQDAARNQLYQSRRGVQSECVQKGKTSW